MTFDHKTYHRLVRRVKTYELGAVFFLVLFVVACVSLITMILIGVAGWKGIVAVAVVFIAFSGFIICWHKIRTTEDAIRALPG